MKVSLFVFGFLNRFSSKNPSRRNQR
ncbi:MAG: hypothetical protein LBM20_04100 [Rikenellaceae bacterium]|nr:hypothetical protein [Rikenellaceae bacterium]